MARNLLKKVGLIIAGLLLVLGLGTSATIINSNNIVNASHHYRHSRRYHRRRYRHWNGIYHKYTHRHHIYLAGNIIDYHVLLHRHHHSPVLKDYHDLEVPDKNCGMKMKMVCLFNKAHGSRKSYHKYRSYMTRTSLSKRDIHYEHYLWKKSK